MNEGLILTLMLWIASVSGYHIQTIPKVIYNTHEELVHNLYGCEKQTSDNEYWCNAPLKENNVLGIYNNDAKTIYFRNDLGSEYSKIAQQSILVHELVHHMQYESGKYFRCRGEKEEEAYDLQNQWLIEQGEKGVQETLKLNGLFLMMITSCTNDLFGS